jgi:hypothetical protein
MVSLDFSTMKFSNILVKKFMVEIYGVEKLLWDRIVEQFLVE